MKQFSSLESSYESFLLDPSKQTLNPLHKKTENIIKISNSQIKARLSYDLAVCWWMLLQAGDEHAERRYKILLKQAGAHTTDKCLEKKISQMLIGSHVGLD